MANRLSANRLPPAPRTPIEFLRKSLSIQSGATFRDMKKFSSAAGAILLLGLSSAFAAIKALLDYVGRIAAFQDIGDKNGYTAKFLIWVFSTPWWVPSLIFVGSAALLLAVIYEAFRTSSTTYQSAINGTAPSQSLYQIVKDNYIYSGSHRTLAPRFVAKFCSNGREAVFYLEYSFLPTGVMGQVNWSRRKKIEVYAKVRFAKDEDINFDIAFPSDVKERVVWRLGRQDQDSEPLIDRAFYRGRVTVADAQGIEQHTYFYMQYDFTRKDGPELIGQHIFDAATAWA